MKLAYYSIPFLPDVSFWCPPKSDSFHNPDRNPVHSALCDFDFFVLHKYTYLLVVCLGAASADCVLFVLCPLGAQYFHMPASAGFSKILSSSIHLALGHGLLCNLISFGMKACGRMWNGFFWVPYKIRSVFWEKKIREFCLATCCNSSVSDTCFPCSLISLSLIHIWRCRRRG